jgi:hypothetical protein
MAGKDERRRLPRLKTRLSAKVVHGDTVLDCVIRDKNELGARLLLREGSNVPDQFHLLQLKSGELYEARLVWTSYPECGVTFASTTELSKESSPDLARFKRLWMGLSA